MIAHLTRLAALAVAASLTLAVTARAVTVGQPAPAFTLKDSNGTAHALSDFKGKWVVLEWYNPSCPFVVKHYANGDMQRLQAEFTAQGVVWLQVNSTNPKHQDFRDAAASHANRAEWKVQSTATLLDPEGTVGKAYDARTTPHMYIVNPAGQLVYAGAIDSIRSTNAADVAKADNFVRAALTAGLAGQPIANPTTRPYGCSVKYP